MASHGTKKTKKAADIRRAVADTLKELREEHGLSQEALALSAQVDRSYVSRIERAIRVPTLELLFRLSKGLNVEPEDFVRRVNEKVKSGSN